MLKFYLALQIFFLQQDLITMRCLSASGDSDKDKIMLKNLLKCFFIYSMYNLLRITINSLNFIIKNCCLKLIKTKINLKNY